MPPTYVCDIECNECQRRSAHSTWKDAHLQGCKYCPSRDIGYVKTYGVNPLRTNCQECGEIYEGSEWSELPKECCGMHTLPLGEMPPDYMIWWDTTPPAERSTLRKIVDAFLYGV